MTNKKNLLNTLLIAVLGAALLAAVLVRTFAPAVILPGLTIPNMVLLSLAALLLDHYLAPNAQRCYVCTPLFSALAFGFLPFAAGFADAGEAVQLGIIGAVVFTVTTWLFTSMMDRLSTGPAAKIAPVFSALGLYLAFQALMGMIL